MASIISDSERGFTLIEEKLGNLTNDIGTMIERKEISNEAAEWLLNEFKAMANICREHHLIEEEKTGTHHISF